MIDCSQMFAVEVIPPTARFREAACFMQAMAPSINLITRYVLDDARHVVLSSAVGRANTQTKPAVFVVKAHFAGPSCLMPCRQQVSLIANDECTVSGTHQLLCRFRVIITAQKSLAALRVRG
jgi:hypothetical protein